MLSIYQITHANGVCFMPGGFVLFRGYLQRASALQTLQAFILAFVFFGLPGGLPPAALMIAICFAFDFKKEEREKRGRTRGKCLFTLFEVGGVFLGAWRTEGKE